eukprot:8444492-Alexandrium_andersonii.AAC.1
MDLSGRPAPTERRQTHNSASARVVHFEALSCAPRMGLLPPWTREVLGSVGSVPVVLGSADRF